MTADPSFPATVSRWKQAAINAYYAATWPFRRLVQARLSRSLRSPVVALFYHRVADDHPNGWTICKSEFTRQIEWLRRHFDVISLEEAQRRLRHGASRPSAVITFDDGYADNCEHAIPLLLRTKTPFTYFVSNGFVESGQPFPHDVHRGECLTPNSVEQLRAMARAGVEIGAHTRTHCDLGRLHDPQRLRSEIVDAGDELAAMIGARVRYFAFPYGKLHNWTAPAFDMALRRYEVVCSAYGGYNLPGDDPRHLQRIHGDPCFARFRNQLTCDPRLLWGTPRYVDTSSPATDSRPLANSAQSGAP